MKTQILILQVLLFSAASCKAQNNSISSSQATINGYSVFKTSSQILIQNFGQPLNVEEYFFEMENTTGELYHYDGLSFYVIDDKIDGFEITGDQYEFTSGNIAVGDGIDLLQSTFPNSFSNKGEGEMIVTFSDADYFISFHYDENNIIDKISLYVN